MHIECHPELNKTTNTHDNMVTLPYMGLVQQETPEYIYCRVFPTVFQFDRTAHFMVTEDIQQRISDFLKCFQPLIHHHTGTLAPIPTFHWNDTSNNQKQILKVAVVAYPVYMTLCEQLGLQNSYRL